jgi:hydroxyacylglutathione hydrolase
VSDPKASDLYFVQEPVGEMANLAYLIGSRATREALIVDPAWDVASLLERAESDGMRVVGALATHYHQDHVGGSLFGMTIEGLPQLMAAQAMPVHVHTREAEGVRRVTGLAASDFVAHEGGDEITLGAIRVRLLHTPGHTPGSQCFLVEEAGQAPRLVSGDTLFLNGCGRVDLPGGDPEAMYRSLHDVLKQLPEATLVYPGHLYSEPVGTLGEQKRTNPYLRVASLEGFLGFMGF